MPSALTLACDWAAHGAKAPSADLLGKRYLSAIESLGARAIYARAYRRPFGPPDERNTSLTNHDFIRLTPRGFLGSEAQVKIDRVNPLPAMAQRVKRLFSWREAAWRPVK